MDIVMDWLSNPATPLLVPLATAAVLVFLRHHLRLQRAVATAGAALLLVSSVLLLYTVWADGIRVSQMGNWEAPYGITLVADLLSATMVVVTALMGLAVVVYSWIQVDAARQHYGYFALLHILLMGVCGAFLTGDIFNMYVWFEVMLIASFVLLALGGERAQLEGAIKYVTLNLLASSFFLAAVGILYGAIGTLNLADLALKLDAIPDPRVTSVLAMLFLVAFGIKAAVFPFFFWLPASYHTPPAAISAIFAALLTKVGVYAIIRVFTLLFVHDVQLTHFALLIIAGVTMVTGVLGAVAQNEFRRILSFHIVSQIGYMVMGLAIFTPMAVAGSVFYVVHHIIVKANLFLVSGVVHRAYGTGELPRLGGLYTHAPAFAILFLIPAMSLAGLPPLSGFFAKLILLKAALDNGNYVIAGVALAVGLLTLYSMTKIWTEVFWKPLPEPDRAHPSRPAYPGRAYPGRLSEPSQIVPMIALGAITVTIGLAAGPLFVLATQAADQLLDPQQYITAVLGSRSP